MNEYYPDEEYQPDNWVVLKIKEGKGTSPIYKVLAGWSGGYIYGDSWRLNSGITKVTQDGDYLLFHGYSGSIYRCHKDTYRSTMAISGVYNSLLKAQETFDGQVQLMPEETNWLELKNEKQI